MLSENVFGRELQKHAVDELVGVRDEVPLFGRPVALLAAEQDAAGRHQDEPIQRHGVSVMDVPDPLGSEERIAAGNVATSSTICAADADDGVSGKVPVDADRTDDTVYMVYPDRSGQRDLPLISDLSADSRCYEQRREQQYDSFFHVFYEFYNQ